MRHQLLQALTAVCFATGVSAVMVDVNQSVGGAQGVPDQVASPSGGAYNYQVMLPAPANLLVGGTSTTSSSDVPARQLDTSTVYGRPMQGNPPQAPPAVGYIIQNYAPAQTNPVIFPSSGGEAPANQQTSGNYAQIVNPNFGLMHGLASLLNVQPSSGGSQAVKVGGGVVNYNGQNGVGVVQAIPNISNTVTSSPANTQSGPLGGQWVMLVSGSSPGTYQQPSKTPSEGQGPKSTGQGGRDQTASGSEGVALDDFAPPEPQHVNVFDGGDSGEVDDKFIDDDEDQPEPQVIVLRLPVAQPVPVAVPYKVAVPVPHPYPVPVHVVERYEVPVEKIVEELVEKKVPVLVETIVPYPVIKHTPVHVEKLVPVPKPYPYPVPVHVVKYIHHYSKKSSGGKGKDS